MFRKYINHRRDFLALLDYYNEGIIKNWKVNNILTNIFWDYANYTCRDHVNTALWIHCSQIDTP